jgi:hypothetical protein
MVKRIIPIRVISFCLLVACEALCQSDRRSADLLQSDGSKLLEAPGQEMRTWRSLPDTPSAVQPPKQTERFRSFADEARMPLKLGPPNTNSVRRGIELRRVTPGLQPTFSTPYEAIFTQEDNLISKYLYPSSLKPSPLYHPSTSSGFMGRATYSASRIFVTRDDSGKKRLNTSYFLGVLSSVAIHSAYRPYYARSSSAPFNDFGSTIGNDAGINLFHEFGPGFRQMVKHHTPKFALKLGERITHDQKLK